jgi:hypothetical protein
MDIQRDILFPHIYINEPNRPNTPENQGITMPKNITYAPKRPIDNKNKGDFNDITFKFPSLNNNNNKNN